MSYVAVVKALYDYEAQDPEGELSFKEDQILYVIEKGDDEWWKAKLKDDMGNDAPIGLIPCTYVEEIPPINTTRALYPYESTSAEELSMEEDAVLHVFSIEDEWLLVQVEGGAKVLGFVPKNYCEPLDQGAEIEVEDAAESVAAVEAQRTAEEEEQRKRDIAAKQRELRLKDKVETWSVSEMDGKKKKKGTLGVGNGAIFFASHSDKSPVKQYPISDLTLVEPSSKRLALTLASLPDPLLLHCGAADITNAIVAKLESSKAAAGEALELGDATHTSSGEEDNVTHTAIAESKSVRWAEDATPATATGAQAETLMCIVLYDFEAQGEDELTVVEGEQLTIVDKENDEWWLVRNSNGQEGVVPAQYVEMSHGPSSPTVGPAGHEDEARRRAEEEEAAAAVEAARREEEERKLEERRAIERAAIEKERQEAEDRALAQKLEAEERAKRERRERRKEEEARRRREEEAAQRREAARQLEPPQISKRPSAQDVAAAARNLPSGRGKSAPERPPESNRPKPNLARTRVWSDRTGQFQVEAEFLGLNGNKVRLHKLNGVIIEVPMDKMSAEDSQLIRRHMARKQQNQAQLYSSIPDNDETPSSRSRAVSSQESRARAESPIPAAAMEMPKPRRPQFDWFAFFLDAGCDMDDCTRYAANFDRDRIDESILADLETSTMRSLGLREGDVIRVKKAISNKYAKKTPEQESQIRQDEEYARQLQEHENSGGKGPAPQPPPSLFTGPNGKLANNTRRGRPERKGTTTDTVDASALAAASDQLSKVSLTPSPTPPITVSPPPESKPAPKISGFDDDAWTIKPAIKPASPAPTTAAPTAPTAPTAPPAPPLPPPATAPAQAQPSGTDSLLAQIQSLRPASTGISSNNTGGSFDALSQISGQRSYGLGTNNTTSPMSQLLTQPTGARGPLAPVPSNEGLLNPLQPTQTGVFIPTRANQQQGYAIAPQQTGYVQQQPMMMQPTGYAQGFQQGYGQHMQPNFTGYHGNYQQQQQQQQSSFNAIANIPPPQPPQNSDKFAPSNIFSAMKRSDFAKPEEQAPQPSDKYDALRPLTTGYNGAPGIMPQQTGMMMPQQTGMMMSQQTGMMAPQQTGMMGGMMPPQMTGYPNMSYMGPQNPYSQYR